ncbi:MAG: LacI family DNA-binding transcriptional regulator [Cytophagales bacterium]|nr:LacI family DNA-binding transcriptional regulator [Cytophagales bacterium]
MKFYTIKEIAKLAGVSAGTVDRVLHNRGKVSPEKEEKVTSILKQIDYKPNPVARSLKLNKRYRFAVILPDDGLDEYWKPCYDGIRELSEALQEKGISVEILKYAPNHPADFANASKQSLKLNPDGVLLGALFLKESRQYLARLKQRQIPFNLINTIVENSGFQSFVGQNLIQSGRTAAHLFDTFLPKPKSVLIVHMEEEYENAFHMQQKEEGFRSYFSERREPVSISTVNVRTDGQATIMDRLKEFGPSGIDGIFVTTSKAHLIADTGLDVPIIGYDLLRENIRNLRKGKIRFLIYQNPKLQAFQGLSYLSDFLLRNIRPPEQKFLPIEIISPENVSSYRI